MTAHRSLLHPIRLTPRLLLPAALAGVMLLATVPAAIAGPSRIVYVRTLAGGPVWEVDYDPRGRYFAYVRSTKESDSDPGDTHPRSVTVAEPATGKTLKTLSGMTSHIWDIAISPSGDRLAACAQDGTLRTWAVPSGRPLGVGKLPEHALKCLAWSRDGRTIATGDFAFGVTTWDAGTLRRTRRASLTIGERMHLGINQVAFTANGKRLISLTDDEAFVTWTLPGLQKVREFASYPTTQFATDGRTVIHLSERPWRAGTDRSLVSWDLQTGRTRLLPPTLEPFAFWRGAGHVVGVTDDSQLAVGRRSDGKELVRGPRVPNPDGMVSAVAVSPDGRRIVAGHWNNNGLWMYEVR